MNLISVLLQQLDRSSPGSVETAKQVIGMLNGAAPETALFFGDDTYTPRLISEKFGCRLCAALTDDQRAERAVQPHGGQAARARKGGRP